MIYRLLATYRKNPAPSELLPKREGRAAGVGMLGDTYLTTIEINSGSIVDPFNTTAGQRLTIASRREFLSRFQTSRNRLGRASASGSRASIRALRPKYATIFYKNSFF
jgi:hypothetical protein